MLVSLHGTPWNCTSEDSIVGQLTAARHKPINPAAAAAADTCYCHVWLCYSTAMLYNGDVSWP